MCVCVCVSVFRAWQAGLGKLVSCGTTETMCVKVAGAIERQVE